MRHNHSIKSIKIGEYFTLKDYGNEEVSENVVWVRGEYDKATKKYSCHKFNDVCHERLIKGDKEVFIDFIF